MSEITNGAKSVLKSKMDWFNTLICVVAILGLAQETLRIPPVVMPFVLLAIGICNIILRTFFTNQGVKIK